MAIEKINKEKFIQWFVGFAEGDGSWNVDKSNSSYSKVSFVIDQKDPKVLYKIKSFFGFGKVNGPYYHKKTNKPYYRYYVVNQKHTKVLIETFNGKLVLKKTTERFEAYVNCYNNLPEVIISSNQVILEKKEIFPSYSDAWLSGFIDAEGCFFGHVRKDWSKISLNFSMSQKAEKEVFNHLKKLIGGSLFFENEKYFRLKVEKSSNIQSLIDYLENYPLRSSKHISFVRFKKIRVRITVENFRWSQLGRRAQERLKKLVKALNDVPIEK